jgi:hypothetical protein
MLPKRGNLFCEICQQRISENPVPGSLDKKKEEDAIFCLMQDSIFLPPIVSNEPGTVFPFNVIFNLQEKSRKFASNSALVSFSA